MKKLFLLSMASAIALNAEILVYGPGGPAPVMKQLAAEFEKKTGEKVIITAGPTPAWIEKAKKDADIIYSGNSSMMDSFVKTMPQILDSKNIQILNMRPSGIVVRPNNPKNIQNFEDLFNDGVNVMVVDGAGQVGLYEDMALKGKKIENLEKLRKNIKIYAKNSKMAVDAWNNDKSIDALIIWSHWAKVLGEQKAKFIKAGGKYIIYRAAEIIPTNKGIKNEKVLEFIKFTKSKQAQKIWKQNAWIANK